MQGRDREGAALLSDQWCAVRRKATCTLPSMTACLSSGDNTQDTRSPPTFLLLGLGWGGGP